MEFPSGMSPAAWIQSLKHRAGVGIEDTDLLVVSAAIDGLSSLLLICFAPADLRMILFLAGYVLNWINFCMCCGTWF